MPKPLTKKDYPLTPLPDPHDPKTTDTRIELGAIIRKNTPAEICAFLVRLDVPHRAACMIVHHHGWAKTYWWLCTIDDSDVDKVCKQVSKGGDDYYGCHIPATAITQMKQAIGALQYAKLVSRVVDVNNIGPVECYKAGMRSRRWENDWKMQKDRTFKIPAPSDKAADWPRWTDDTTDVGRGYRLASGALMAYLMRPATIPPKDDDDPETNYSNEDEEIILLSHRPSQCPR